mmetsp:Transcript_57576/g.141183  ORF Transcript_57576/g.141183 Transcript_57576/m.141183 type:complete len:226 (-) Transcript_57576:106-783(-)
MPCPLTRKPFAHVVHVATPVHPATVHLSSVTRSPYTQNARARGPRRSQHTWSSSKSPGRDAAIPSTRATTSAVAASSTYLHTRSSRPRSSGQCLAIVATSALEMMLRSSYKRHRVIRLSEMDSSCISDPYLLISHVASPPPTCRAPLPLSIAVVVQARGIAEAERHALQTAMPPASYRGQRHARGSQRRRRRAAPPRSTSLPHDLRFASVDAFAVVLCRALQARP